MSRITIYEDDDFRIQMDLISGQPFMHVDAYNYNKSVKKKMLSVWKDIQEEVWNNGWDFIFSYNTNAKFARLFGWSKVDVDNITGEMYSWRLGH